MSAREKDQAQSQAGQVGPAERPSNPGRSTLVGGDNVEGDGLPYRQKSLFESALGRDLSGVRVHTDDAAAEKADAHDARAFAVGSDIHFAKGQYKPGTAEGDQLLAHEVAHTVQQQGATAKGEGGGDVEKTTPGDRAEQNADAAAGAMVEGRPAEVTSEPVAIARKARSESVDAPPPSSDGPSSADGAAPVSAPASPDSMPGEGPAKEGEEEIGELSAERVGQESDEGSDEPVGPSQDPEAFKAQVQTADKDMPQEGEVAGKKPEGGGDAGGGSGEAEVSAELFTQIEGAKADAKEGAAEAEAESAAFKAELRERRDRFDAEQSAIAIEQLRTMSGADKRAALIDLGYDPKAVKKMKDRELDGIITGRLETEQRKTRILGMDEEELAKLSPAQKSQFLIDLGIDAKDVRKIGPQKAAKAFDDIMRVAHVPGKHKIKVKVKGGLLAKSWDVSINVDAEGQADFDVKKKGGLLSKLWGWIKAIAPIVLMFVLPAAGVIALAVFQAVTSIIKGDWLGAVLGVAGAFVGVGALKAVQSGASGAAKAFKQIATVAAKVEKGAKAAQSAIAAAKAKSPGGFLGALANGAAAVAGFAGAKAAKFRASMERWSDRLEKWSKVVTGGEKVIQGAKTGNIGTALGGAFDSVAALTSKPDPTSGKETDKKATQFQKLSRIAGFAAAGQRAAQGEDWSGVVDAALGIAGELKTNKKFQDSLKISSAANRLGNAIATKDPQAIAAAGLALAESIQLAKYDADNPTEFDEKGNPVPQKDEKGNPIVDDDREAITNAYKKATSVVRLADSALKAATAKPRPNYLAVLDAAAGLIAELTESKKLDQAAIITSRLDAWTAAVRSKNDQAILEAGLKFGEAINGMRDIINADREAAKKAAEAKLKAGETLDAEDPGPLQSIPINAFSELPGTVVPMWPYPEPEFDGEGKPIAIAAPEIPLTPGVTTSETFRLNPRMDTPGANYTVISGDTLSAIAKLFNVALAQLRNVNAQLDGDKIFVGQQLYVPGALTPNVTTEVGSARTLPGQTPGETEPGGLPIPDRDSDPDGTIREAIQLAEKFGTLTEWPPFLQEFLGVLRSNITAYQTLEKGTDGYKSAVAVLKAAAASTKWADAVVKKIAGYEGDFKGMIDIDGDAQAVRILATYARVGRGAVRATNNLNHMLDAADAFVVMMGIHPDGRTATTLERAAAAKKLAEGGFSLAKDVKWMGDTARFLAPKLVDTLEGVLARMGGAVSRVSGRLAGPVMDRVFRPMLEKVAREKGVGEASRLASQLADDVARWGATHWAKSQASRAAFQRATAALATAAAGTVGILAGPLYWVYEYYKFLHDELPGWYFDARSGMSTLQSPRLFGKVVHDIKDDVRRQIINTAAQGETAIRFFYDQLFRGAESSVQAGWPAFAKRHLLLNTGHGPNARQWHRYAGSASELLPSLDEYSVAHVARYLQGGALVYIDQEYQRVFGVPPPATS